MALLQVILNSWCDVHMLHALKATSKALHNEFKHDKMVQSIYEATKQIYLNEFKSIADKIHCLSTPTYAFIQQLSAYPKELQLTVSTTAIDLLKFEVLHYLLGIGMCPHQLSKLLLSSHSKHFQSKQSQMMRMLVQHGASTKDLPNHLYQKMSLNNIMFLLVRSDLNPNLTIDDHGTQLLYHVLTNRGLYRGDQYSFLCDFMHYGCNLYHPHGPHANVLLADALLISVKVSPAVKHYILRNKYTRFMVENPVTHKPYLEDLVRNTEFDVWKEFVVFEDSPILYLLGTTRDLSMIEGQQVFMALVDAGASLHISGKRPVVDQLLMKSETTCLHLVQTLLDRGALYTGNWNALVLDLGASPNYLRANTNDQLTLEAEYHLVEMFKVINDRPNRSTYYRACEYIIELGKKYAFQHLNTQVFLKAVYADVPEDFEAIDALAVPFYNGPELYHVLNRVYSVLRV